MARLAANDLPATTNTTVYTVPANRRAAFSVHLCNRTAGDRIVRLALSSGATTNADWIEFDVPIPANSPLERSGLALTAGQSVVAWASATGVSCVITGIEEQV